MFDYNDIMKNYMKKEEEVNTIEKKQKKKKLNPKKNGEVISSLCRIW